MIENNVQILALGFVGRCWHPDALSAIEYEPANFVAQPLIVQNKSANRIRQLLTLPLTLQATCLVLFTLNDGCPRSLYCIGGGAEFVRGYMCDDTSLSSSIGCIPSSSTQISCSPHCMATHSPRLHHLYFATSPSSSSFDCLTRSRV
jgi:hypothetical protein